MQKRLTEAVLEGEREGQKRPPPRCQGPRPPPAQKHAGSAGMLGHLAVSRPTPCEFGRNEGVRGPSGNRGSQGSHPCGGSPRRAEGWRGEAPVGFGGEASGAPAGLRAAAHTPALRDARGSKPAAGPPGQGWPRGHLDFRTACRVELPAAECVLFAAPSVAPASRVRPRRH